MDRTLKKWSLDTGKEICCTNRFSSYVWGVCSNNSAVFAVTWSGRVFKLNFDLQVLVPEKPLRRIHRDHAGEHFIRCTETHVATASGRNPEIHVMDTELNILGEVDLQIYNMYISRPSSVALSEDKLLASVVLKETDSIRNALIAVWDLQSLQLIKTIPCNCAGRIAVRGGNIYASVENIRIFSESDFTPSFYDKTPKKEYFTGQALDVFGNLIAGDGGGVKVLASITITSPPPRPAQL
jgi:hypothetical protein